MRVKRVLHVFRNTPIGRETLLGAIQLCAKTGMQLYLYLPEEPRFTLQFEEELVEVPLDGSYVTDRGTARRHAEGLADEARVKIHWVKPHHRLASTLPVLAGEFDLMTCPRLLTDPSQGIAPGLLGSRVRRLIRSANHPVIVLPAPALDWDHITVFFAGSEHALRALAWARRLAAAAGVDYRVFTHGEKDGVERARRALESAGFLDEVRPRWSILDERSFAASLWNVPRRSLVVAGAFGTGAVKARLFGSRTELLLARLPNPLFLAGPNARAPKG